MIVLVQGTSFQRGHGCLDILDSFSAKGIKGTKTEMTGTAGRLTETKTEKEDA